MRIRHAPILVSSGSIRVSDLCFTTSRTKAGNPAASAAGKTDHKDPLLCTRCLEAAGVSKAFNALIPIVLNPHP